MSSLTRSFTRLGFGLLALASIGATVVGPASASSVTAAVPGEVVRYIADGLIADLDEFYGLGVDGSGTDFTDATAVGATRVFSFTEDFLAGNAEEPAVRRLNEWVTVVTVGVAPADQVPVGVALVSIDPVTVSPQLSSFTASADFGTVIAALPETATLVRDAARSAWFSLDGEAAETAETPDTPATAETPATPAAQELTPVVSGTSRVTEPIALAEYRDVVANWPTSEPSAGKNEPTTRDGFILVGLAVALIVLLVAVEAFLPSWRRRAAAKEEAEADTDADAEPAAEPDPEPDPDPAPALAPKSPVKPRAKPKPKPKPESEPAPELAPAPAPQESPAPKPPAKPRAKQQPKPKSEPKPETAADPDAG